MISFVMFACFSALDRYAVDCGALRRSSRRSGRREKNHFIIMSTVLPVSPFKWWIAYWSKSTDLLFMQSGRSTQAQAMKYLPSEEFFTNLLTIDSIFHNTNPLRLLSDNFSWVKIFNFSIPLFRGVMVVAEMKQHRWRQKKNHEIMMT